MKIGIDARLYSQAGIGRYIRNLLLALVKIDQNNNYVVYLREEEISNFQFSIFNFHKGNIQTRIANYPWYSISEQVLFPIQLYKDKLDLLFVPHFNAPVFYFKKTVVTIHDLIMHRDEPSSEVTTRPTLIYIIKKYLYKMVFFISVFKAKKIFVPTRYVADSLNEYLPFNVSSKTSVTFEALDNIFLDKNISPLADLSKYGVKDPFLLYVGSAYPHKNLKDLIIAFKHALPQLGGNIQLVILGKRDLFLGRIREFSNGLGLGDFVLFPSFIEGVERIDDTLLIPFYQNATALVSASLEEGFNLTPLEAMANGIPCAISDIPVHREIYKDSVLFFDPKSIKGIADAMLAVSFENSVRSNLINKGSILLSKYSWEETAKKTLQGFNS